jgi:hypothetical protein
LEYDTQLSNLVLDLRLSTYDSSMRKIKKFEPLSVMRVAAVGYGVLGLFEGAIFAVVFSFVPFAAPEAQRPPRFLGPLFGGFAIIGFPLLFGAMGAIGGGLGAVIYNVTARYIGGIEVEVE